MNGITLLPQTQCLSQNNGKLKWSLWLAILFPPERTMELLLLCNYGRIKQYWNNCNLVKWPNSVGDLLVLGENRFFNFLESFIPLNMREGAENWLPAAFQFWAQPKVKNQLDKNINVLVTNVNTDPTIQGSCIMLLASIDKTAERSTQF